MSSYDTYLTEEQKRQNKLAEEDIAQKAKDAEERKAQINATLDQSAAAQTGVYEQAIADVPLQSRALYDRNALQEAVNRKKIQETLSNMGMSDSGLSSSMHTALAVQKSRADNQVRADEHQTIRAYESAIDQILADTEAQKASAAIEIDQGVADYKIDRKAQAETNATNTATSLYNADLEAYTAQQKQQQANQDSRIKYAQSVQDARTKRAEQYIDAGMEPDVAWEKAYKDYPENVEWEEAYRMYPDTSTEEGIKYAYINQAKNAGYIPKLANIAADAYVSALRAGKSSDAAENVAFLATINEAISMLNMDAYVPDRSGKSSIISDIDSFSIHTERVRDTLNRCMPKENAEYAAAIQMGSMCSKLVEAVTDENTLYKIQQAIESEFAGAYLEAALDAAGFDVENYIEK